LGDRYRYLLLATSALTFVLVSAGGVVCVTDSSGGCPDWPACYGRLVPPPRLDSILEYTHRVIAGLTALLVVASAVAGWRRYRAIRWLSRPPAIAIALLFAVAIFGAVVVLHGLAPGFALLDIGSALSVLGLMVAATVVAFGRHAEPDLPDHLSFSTPLTQLARWTLIGVFVVLVSGVLVAAPGSPVRCLGWPLFSGGLDLAGVRRWLALARLLLAAAATVLVALLAARAWRVTQPPAVRPVALGLGLLLGANVVAGLVAALLGSPASLLAAAALLASALWATLVGLVTLLALPGARSNLPH
jgi:heme a synthase